MRRPAAQATTIALSVVIADQATKYLAHSGISPASPVGVFPFLQLVNVRNTGSAFGMFSGLGNAFFIVATIAALAFIAYIFSKEERGGVGLSLVFGGAVGNLIDRVALGYVRDFIDFYVSGFHWPAFNVADSALTVGISLYLVSSLMGGSRRAG